MCQQGGANPIVLDAIVSNKTFGNATSVPTFHLRTPNFRACKFAFSCKSFGKKPFFFPANESFSLHKQVLRTLRFDLLASEWIPNVDRLPSHMGPFPLFCSL
jgi:hypothetical protein